jgi:hypothetical protein
MLLTALSEYLSLFAFACYSHSDLIELGCVISLQPTYITIALVPYSQRSLRENLQFSKILDLK